MKAEPFGYLPMLEGSLSAAPSTHSVTAKVEGSRSEGRVQLNVELKPEAQFQCMLSRVRT